MGLLESAVVVYLRELYYPEGFAFPLKPMSPILILTEILREAATLVMLIAIGVLAGRTRTERFGYFVFTFAVWDIFYYLFLKLLLNWPESLLTWDILFLLPTTWVGPVIAPVILSLLMIALSLAISYFTDRSLQTRIIGHEWLALVTGSLVVIVSFTLAYVQFMLSRFSWVEFLLPNAKVTEQALLFVPQHFHWGLFSAGVLIIAFGLAVFIFRTKKIQTAGVK
ncbi:MAG: hypothetical protein CVU09_07970 [Bacteroidetes bacterium HGW-Bacteroidetes-4]|nr:MAG: hypothetical protein CVU09_07970 [Bacteroidetes bacterium HGW-Bacteroidetes-4]